MIEYYAIDTNEEMEEFCNEKNIKKPNIMFEPITICFNGKKITSIYSLEDVTPSIDYTERMKLKRLKEILK
jgi:hypothetical protein